MGYLRWWNGGGKAKEAPRTWAPKRMIVVRGKEGMSGLGNGRWRLVRCGLGKVRRSREGDGLSRGRLASRCFL